MKAEKIIKSIPFAKRIIQASAIEFSVINQNGFFLAVMGNPVLEFDFLQDAQAASDSLNQLIDSIKKSYIANYEQKIEEILNA